jgi:hypothetical protein
MAQERIILAIGRIEHALSRLEQAKPSTNSASAVDVELLTKHEALKSEVREVLHDIDTLIQLGGR